MNPPRILFVTKYHLMSIVGGAEEQCWLLSTKLARRGWDVHYASEMERAPQPAKLDGVTHHALPPNPSPWTGNRAPLRQLMRDLQPDVVFNEVCDLYTGYSICDAPETALTVLAGAAEADGFIGRRLTLIRRNLGLTRFLRRLPQIYHMLRVSQKGARKAKLVTAQHRIQQQDFARLGIQSVILRNPQLPVLEEDVQRHDGDPVVLWVGSVKDWKRPQKFIDLARRCRDLKAQFVMIGLVQEEKYCQVLAAAVAELSNFRYDGFIPLERVDDYYKSAHLYVSTSRGEGYPNTFIHAWLHGVPVVSLDVDVEDTLAKGGLGVLVKSDDELENTARRLLADPNERRVIGTRAREYAMREFDLTAVVDKLEALLRERGVRPPRG